MTTSTRHAVPGVIAAALALALMSLLVFAAPAAAAEAYLSAELSGAAEIDAEGNPNQGDPDGGGSADFGLDTETGVLCYSVVAFDIATPTAAHIHEGVGGENGPIVVPLVAPAAIAPSSYRVDGICITVDAALLAAIAENPAGYYLNVHNDEYPDGALRGQLFLYQPECPSLAVFSGEFDEGSNIALVRVGEEAVVAGNFAPGPAAEFELFLNGESVRAETVAVSAPLYHASIELTFEAGDEGIWTVVGRNPDVPGCEGSVEITVSAAAQGGGGNLGTPTPTPAPMLPDTATSQGSGSPPLGIAVGLFAVLATSALVAVRMRGLSAR